MIPGTSAMDKPVARSSRPSRVQMALLVGAGLLVIAVGVSLPGILRWSRADRAVDASRLNFGAVRRGDLDRDVSGQGRIVAALHPTLFSPVAGIVTLAVKAGTEVKKGQFLARIESPELMSRRVQERSTLQALQSDLGRQEIAARQAAQRAQQASDILAMRLAASERAMTRAEELLQQGLINRVDFERAKDDLSLARLEQDSARQAAQFERESLTFEVANRRLQVARQQSIVTETERQVRQLEMAAPFDGMVANVNVQDRDAVAMSAPVMTVVNLSAFEVEFDVAENYASDLVPGTPAEVLYEGKTYAGKVTAVSPEIRDSQVRGTVVFADQQPPGLRQSQRVSVRLLLERKANVLKAPRGPFVEAGGGRTAYVVQDGMAVKREIAVGAMSVSEVEIVSGLSEGDQLVVSDTSLFEGARTVLIRR
jgi:HlyD family secretion protein